MATTTKMPATTNSSPGAKMTLRFLSPQTAAVARDVSLLDLLSEFVDANADTVCLITADQRTELEWSAHCDYLRALQRLGHETLARHDQRVPAAPLAFAVVSGLGTALTGGWTAALLIWRGPARAAHALRPGPHRPGVSTHPGEEPNTRAIGPVTRFRCATSRPTASR